MVRDTIRVRFNMDDKKPKGRKVGMLDSYQLWAHIMDPFAYVWRDKFDVGNLRALAKEMIAHYVPANAGTELHVRRHRDELMLEFQVSNCATFHISADRVANDVPHFIFIFYETKEYISHTGRWANLFDEPIPHGGSLEEVQQRASEITLDDVTDWGDSGSMNAT